jgi:hypothetical protein
MATSAEVTFQKNNPFFNNLKVPAFQPHYLLVLQILSFYSFKILLTTKKTLIFPSKAQTKSNSYANQSSKADPCIYKLYKYPVQLNRLN